MFLWKELWHSPIHPSEGGVENIYLFLANQEEGPTEGSLTELDMYVFCETGRSWCNGD